MVALARDFAQAKGFIEPPGYRRHRPESTLLYRLVAEHYPKFRDRWAAEERGLPRHVEEEFEAYLKCGRLEAGFLRVQCDSCQAEKLLAFSCKRRGFCPSCGARRTTASLRLPWTAETAALILDDILQELDCDRESCQMSTTDRDTSVVHSVPASCRLPAARKSRTEDSDD